MAYRFLPLMAIAGLLIIFCLPHNAYSDFSSNNKYLIQATGFVAGTQDVLDSTFDIQLTTGTQSGTSILSTLDNSLVTISGDSYLNTGNWTVTLLRDGKYLLLQGNAVDQRGNTLQLNLFGRQIDSTQNGIVYSITGKITGSETFRVIYSAKATISGSSTTQTSTSQTQQNQPTNVVRINIVAGASNSNNQLFFSPSFSNVPPGTTIIWTNNDSVPHQIMSGVASATGINGSAPKLAPDGMINSGIIAPGKSFQYTITNFNSQTYLSPAAAQYLNLPQEQTAGDITFFDPTYTWMLGVISPSSVSATPTMTTQINILQGAATATNTLFLSPSSVQITPGSTVIWKNNDSVAHRILSGQSKLVTTGSRGVSVVTAPSFTPDGRIDSGMIAPGQTFQYTVSSLGVFSFYDPSNTWINGNIISVSQISKTPPVQVSILPGSSLAQGSASQQNLNYVNGYYSPDQIQISPGTTIIWTNNDSIAHSIFSGTATFSTTNPYVPDGKIKSGMIAPGQTFEVTINDTGMIRFYDPSYTWMNGIIVSL
ncbi:MAG TPA: plastocyanin/azurin family copper-binding protein, partial [Candidatus Nitrosotalea sp.]|nr:plastocyanin/azurin family copper-binding protein [Candidatus Nitrosotalea sp.]